MKVLSAALLALALVACGGGPTAPPTPPAYDRQYSLASLTYEDVYPGNYTAEIASFAGSAVIRFGDGVGQLATDAPVTGVMAVTFPDSSFINEPIVILAAGTIEFTFAVDTVGVVTIQGGSTLWALTSGAVLSDSTYTFDKTTCYDEACTDYIRLAFVWMRQP